jgi:hypothetical protein
MALELSCGTLGNEEELAELFVGSATETLGDVRHDGDGSTPHLISQTEIAGELVIGGEPVDHFGQLAGFLPDIEVFEAGQFQWRLWRLLRAAFMASIACGVYGVYCVRR